MPGSEAYPRKVLFLIFLISLFNYIDRQALYAVFPLVKKDLLLTDTQLGLLASSFMLVYMCFAPLVGWFFSGLARPSVIGAGAVVWSAATMLTGMVRTYPQLLFARAAVGIGEAGYGTVSPAYLAEWFPAGSRARVLSIYALAIPAGSALGYLLGGSLGQYFGWRRAFYLTAFPGILLGLAAWRLKETPVRGAAGPQPKLSFARCRGILSNRTYLLVSFSEAIATFSVGGLAAWMPSFFVRNFGISVARAGVLFGAITVLAGIAGNITGGWAADRLRLRTDRAYFIVGYLSFFLSLPFGVLALLSDSLPFTLLMLFLAEFFIFAHSGPYHAAIVEVIEPRLRSMAFAVNLFILHAFGDAVSPTLIGLVSDAAGLTVAVLLAVLFLFFGGATSIMAGYYYRKELQPA